MACAASARPGAGASVLAGEGVWGHRGGPTTHIVAFPEHDGQPLKLDFKLDFLLNPSRGIFLSAALP